MKKTTFKALLCLGLFAMTLSSCGNTNPYANDPRYPIYELALADGFIGTYQQWLETIKGADGENGQTPHIGENGNWWIGDTDTGVPATGPQGPAGSDGEPGSQGEPGKDGADGQDGKDGVDGQDGQDGTTPHIGDNGNWWIGDQDTGIPATGADGQDGQDGKDGADGQDGQPGQDGEDGQDGADGQDGTDGVDGKDGTSMLTGEGAPSDDLGKDGDSYIDTNTWDFYVKVNGTWVLKGNIKADGADHDGTEGLEFYPINDTECAVGVGTAKMLKDIVVPSKYKDYTVTTIIDIGFEYSKVENIYLPSTIKHVGANVFNSTPLTNLYFNGSIEQYCEVEFQSQYNSQFTSSEPLHYYYMDNGNYVEMVDVVIPEGVETINDYAFIGMYHLNSISVPSTVKSIGDYAFAYSLNLKTINIADNSILDSIGDRAFEYCTSLTSVTLGNSVTSIGDRAFYNCTSLTSIVIPDSVTSIGDRAFLYCSSLTSVTLGDGVTSIGSYAFEYCSSLTSIVIPNSVTTIGYYVFSGCYSLTIYCEATSRPDGWDSHWYGNSKYVYWGVSKDNVTFDEEKSFVYILVNDELIISDYIGEPKFINIPSEINGYPVTSIGDRAFSGCTSLTSIVIPDSVASIGLYAFSSCSFLKIYCEATSQPSGWNSRWNDDNRPVYWGVSKDNVTFDEEKSFVYILVNDEITITDYIGEPKFINIPSEINGYPVTTIGDHAFSGCFSLTSIVIPDSVTSIGDCAFYNCSSLTSVTLGNSVTSIENHAFYNCSSLTSIVIPNSVTTIGYYVFSDCSSLTIYCEATSQPSGWNSNWNYGFIPVYWAGQWEYDNNGNPTVITPEAINGAPIEGEQYYFGIDKGDGNVYFADGGMNNYYGSSSTDFSKAVSASVEEVDGGYYLIINDMYVNVTINGTYNNFTYSGIAFTLWKYNEQYNTLVTEINGENYFIGNFGTYTDLAIVNVSYLSSNGCPGRFYK